MARKNNILSPSADSPVVSVTSVLGESLPSVGGRLAGTLEEGSSRALVSGAADSIFKEDSGLFESGGVTLNPVLPPPLPQADSSMQNNKAGTILFHILRTANHPFHGLYDPVEEKDNDIT